MIVPMGSSCVYIQAAGRATMKPAPADSSLQAYENVHGFPDVM